MTDAVDSSERCQRCGEDGEDRRTLWMACFYEMSELGLPFDLVILPLKDSEAVRRFYTLRVCKRCRGDWMAAIRDWFNTKPAPDPEHGIPVRELGSTRMVATDVYPHRFTSEHQGGVRTDGLCNLCLEPEDHPVHTKAGAG